MSLGRNTLSRSTTIIVASLAIVYASASPVAFGQATAETHLTLKCTITTSIFYGNGSSWGEKKSKNERVLSFLLNASSGRFFDFGTGEWTVLTEVTPTALDVERQNEHHMSINRVTGNYTETGGVVRQGDIAATVIESGKCAKIPWREPGSPATKF